MDGSLIQIALCVLRKLPPGFYYKWVELVVVIFIHYFWMIKSAL